MASSSTSSVQTSFKYDVFLSFRGKDTRKTFVDHLYHALQNKSIHTYKDDERIKKGERIGDELIESIEDSKFYIIVFSRNYASSSWCLDELVKIMECQTMTEHTAYLVFYDVEPTEVRYQSGEFGKAFAKQEKKEAAGKWREALKEAANLSGFGLKNTVDGHEAKFIQKIVEEISLELRSINFSVDEKLIGMEDRIRDIVSTLEIGFDDVRMIGIKGMGGGGKTTLARAVFDRISFGFEGSSFVENVRENSNPNLSRLKKLQKQVLKDVLNAHDIKISNVHDGKKMIKKMMSCRKVLIVLDDVDHVDQLKALAGELNWFNKGSRIIITTREKQVLVAHKVANSNIHDVNLLTDDEAICLLSRHAFGKESPNPGYEELSRNVIGYAAGLPLTITVLGSFLCDANEDVWIDTLARLEKIPLHETLQKLELSYMGLDTDCKEIFLDVACLLKWWTKEEAIIALESRGFHAIHGLTVLQNRSLVTISKDGRLTMHDHIEEMGRYIVRRSNLNEPARHSRLWITEEIEDILVNDLGTEATCIKLWAKKVDKKTITRGLRKMEKLRFLDIFYNTRDLEYDEDVPYLPDSLQYLNSRFLLFRVLPKAFQASNLVALEIRYMKQLWERGERKVLPKLRFLQLPYSMLTTFDLGLTPNLEILNLQDSHDLVEFHMPLPCPKLKSLNLKGSKLSTVDLNLFPNIETLNLMECSDLVELHIPCECPQLKFLNVSSPKLRSVDLKLVPNIETLNLNGCCDLVELVMPCKCPQLTSLNLSGSKLRSLDLRLVSNIETLNLHGCKDLVELCIHRECPQLKSLDLSCPPSLRSLNLGPTSDFEILKLEECDYLVEHDMFLECQQLKSLVLDIPKLRTLDIGSIPNLETLKLQGCYNLVELRMHDECCKLRTLSLGCPQLRTFDLGMTWNLEALILDGHDDLVQLLDSVRYQQLEDLEVINSKLSTLELTRNLKKLILTSCDLVELHIPVGDVMLKSLDIKGCSKLKTLDLGGTPNLESLHIEECSSLVKLLAPIGGLKKLTNLKAKGFLRFTNLNIQERNGSLPRLYLKGKLIDTCPLHPVDNFPKFQFDCTYQEDLPSLIGNVEKLISIGSSCACIDLESFFGSICGLQHLGHLSLECDIPEAPKDLGNLQCLEQPTLWSPSIKYLPDSICMLKHLKILHLFGCMLFEKLPEELGRLECLEELFLTSAKIKHLPDSICRLKHLKSFYLYCELLEKLPEELGRLECLEELLLTSAKIKHLPDSICRLKYLKSFYLYCELVEKLPEDLGRLECLEKLILRRCLVLRDIPNSICRLKSPKYLSLEDSIRVEKLPEELGRLECLEELDIRGTSIKNLPPSISLLGGLKIVRSEEGTTRTTTTTTGGCCTVLYHIFSCWHEWILLHCINNRM